MPCRDDGYPTGPTAQEKVDSLTQLLCAACQRMSSYDVPIPHDVFVWWLEHQEADARRQAAEIRRTQDQLEQAEKDLLVAKRQLAQKQAEAFAKNNRKK